MDLSRLKLTGIIGWLLKWWVWSYTDTHTHTPHTRTHTHRHTHAHTHTHKHMHIHIKWCIHISSTIVVRREGLIAHITSIPLPPPLSNAKAELSLGDDYKPRKVLVSPLTLSLRLSCYLHCSQLSSLCSPPTSLACPSSQSDDDAADIRPSAQMPLTGPNCTA